MYSKKVTVQKATGLHARPGSDVVDIATTFSSAISIKTKDKEINAKEVLDILTANINYSDEIEIIASGEDEEIAVEKLVDYIGRP